MQNLVACRKVPKSRYIKYNYLYTMNKKLYLFKLIIFKNFFFQLEMLAPSPCCVQTVLPILGNPPGAFARRFDAR